jgi:hypothetical protein
MEDCAQLKYAPDPENLEPIVDDDDDDKKKPH